MSSKRKEGCNRSAPYAVISHVYDTLEPILRPFRNLTLNLLKKEFQSPKNIRILDAAGGTGSQAGYLARNGFPVVVVDSAWGMLKRGRAKKKQTGSDRFHLVQADAGRLPFPPDTFDAIIVQLAFHEMDSPFRDRCGLELIRVAKENALFLVVDFLRTDRWTPMEWVIQLVERAAGRKHYQNGRQFLHHGGLIPFLEKTGLKNENTVTFFQGNIGLARLRRAKRVPDPASPPPP
jgi:ubiquinone/menaquinone biosynthesis C-methylase UbiE